MENNALPRVDCRSADVFQIFCSHFIFLRKESYIMLRVKERGTKVIYEDKIAETGKQFPLQDIAKQKTYFWIRYIKREKHGLHCNEIP